MTRSLIRGDVPVTWEELGLGKAAEVGWRPLAARDGELMSTPRGHRWTPGRPQERTGRCDYSHRQITEGCLACLMWVADVPNVELAGRYFLNLWARGHPLRLARANLVIAYVRLSGVVVPDPKRHLREIRAERLTLDALYVPDEAGARDLTHYGVPTEVATQVDWDLFRSGQLAALKAGYGYVDGESILP
jgi:hypothetical protein